MYRLLPRAFALVTTAALLSACSSVDLSKPGSWIDTMAGGSATTSSYSKNNVPPPPSAGDKPTVPSQTASTTATPVDPKGKPKVLPSEQAASSQPTEFPNLANQPDVQTPGTTESQRREIREGLIADRDRAQHSAEVLRGGTDKPAAPPAPAPAAKPADGTAPADGKPTDGSASTTTPAN